MPTYLYECKRCEQTFEVDQRITAEPLTDCNCGAEGSLKRLIQPVGIQFVGSGFHSNDYASIKKENSTDTEAPKECANPGPAGECAGGCAQA